MDRVVEGHKRCARREADPRPFILIARRLLILKPINVDAWFEPVVAWTNVTRPGHFSLLTYDHTKNGLN